MVDYEDEVKKEAVNFIEDIMDDVETALKSDEKYILEDRIRESFDEIILDRSYSLSDAAFVLENSRNVEEDWGLWENQKDPEKALEIKAAFTFSNDVSGEIENIYSEMKDKYDERFSEIYDEMMEKAPEKTDADEDEFDPTDDAKDAAFKETEEWFCIEYDPTAKVVTDKSEQISMIKEYMRLKRNAGSWGGYPCGRSYIDSRCGVGYGMPNIHDYVEYDHMIAQAIPDIRGKNKDEIESYLHILKSSS